MDFYKALLDSYDSLFSFEQPIFDFLHSHLPGEGNIVDLGCATGTYTLELARINQHRSLTGVDLEEGFIRKARKKDPGGLVHWIAGDMLRLGEGKRFEGVYCIGNTLPHLSSREAVREFLGKTRKLLSPGGVLILQMINFDRFEGGGESSLPTLEAGGLIFSRRYLPHDSGRVLFDASLEGKISHSLSIPLLSLSREEIYTMLDAMGWKGIRCFGSYREDIWNRDSFLTIFRAHKGKE